jgi:predicted amidohydrolase YtcJ
MQITFRSALAVLIAAGLISTSHAAQLAADTLYVGGDIVTINDAQPSAQALAVRSGKIVGVGDRQVIESKHKGAKTKVVTMVHSQFARKDQLDKYVQYKITPSFYTLHTYYFAEAHINNRGKEQAMYISPMRDAIDKGLRPTNHTDFVVAPLDQMFMLWSAVNRVSRAGEVIGADQRVTPMEGLRAMTIYAARQHREEKIKGSLEPGKLADLVILDKNPLQVEPMAIKDIKVVETIKEGKAIYGAN